MVEDIRAAIADRALGHVGAAFRFKGRSAAAGFDCVGLVGDAISLSRTGPGAGTLVPEDYALRGDQGRRISTYFKGLNWQSLPRGQDPRPGDILVLRTAPRQVHLGIFTTGGLVHAHAGLRRVVLTPLPLPWPIDGHWRFCGG